MRRRRLSLLLAPLAAAAHAATYPSPMEGDFLAQDFQFATGESVSELKLHYTTLGSPARDASGKVVNAVLIMHGTGGSGRGFLSETFAGQLFGAGQLLDAAKYFIVLTDAIGHGKSSKPSDGLAAKFPRYTYEDMVRAQHLLLTSHLRVNHLRLVMGTSMGGMHTWMWGYLYPDFMDALMPLASAPVEIGGRNRMIRQMILDSLRRDPVRGMAAAQFALFIMTSSPLQLFRQAPTRARADQAFSDRFHNPARPFPDANDMIHAYDCSREYNPAPHLEKIAAPLYAVNSADDEVNPPELGVMEREIARVKRGRYILIPISDQTRGHGTHSLPAVWGTHLADLLSAR